MWLDSSGTRPRSAAPVAFTASGTDGALRLRFKVLAEEPGARIDAADGRDSDEADADCEHIVVRDEQGLRVVGPSCRVLLPHGVTRLGRR
jgi:putative hemolysin